MLLAESGATVEQLMSVMGWKTASQAIYYCREANKKTLNRAAWAFLDKEAARPRRTARWRSARGSA